MECYEGAKMIKTFRGILNDGAQEEIRLSTKQGKIGYKIVKFQVMSKDPGTDTVEGTCKIYKISQSTINGTVDFSDGNLLGAAEYHKEQNTAYPLGTNIIFEQEVFNQDIYVTWKDNAVGVSMNYYIELEVMKLNDNEATVSTLMDIRGSS